MQSVLFDVPTLHVATLFDHREAIREILARGKGATGAGDDDRAYR